MHQSNTRQRKTLVIATSGPIYVRCNRGVNTAACKNVVSTVTHLGLVYCVLVNGPESYNQRYNDASTTRWEVTADSHQLVITATDLTSLSCRRRTGAMRCVMRALLYTKVDAQCDKLATIVGRTKLTTLATINVPWPGEIFFTARRNARIASAVLATAIPSVCLSVCLSHAGIV